MIKRFNGREPAVDGLSLSVRPGEIYCLLGGSGSGKTTVVRMLLGLIRPDAGRVELMAHDVAADPVAARQQVTFITGAGTLCDAMTVRQNLEFFVHLGQCAARPADADCRNALRAAGVPDREFDVCVSRLPRDRVVKLWLAIAWIRDAPLLLLDEPTTGLDTKATSDLQTQVMRFRERGTAVCVSTADVLFASQIADRIGVIRRGRKTADRIRAEVLSLSLAELYLDYVGRPPHRTSLESPHTPARLVP